MMKSEYKDVLNALVEMQDSHIYASRKQTLFRAEQAIFSLEQKLLKSELKKPVCDWVPETKNESGVWNTKCGNVFVLIEGSPKDNNMVYCPYCGRNLCHQY